jgi:hypothetical protein
MSQNLVSWRQRFPVHDCTFLVDPENWSNVPIAHRLLEMRTTLASGDWRPLERVPSIARIPSHSLIKIVAA